MPKKQFLYLVLSFCLTIGCICVCFNLAFAWFTTQNPVLINDVSLSVIESDDNGYHITRLNDDNVPDDGFLIYPQDVLKFELIATENNPDFCVQITNGILSDQKFNDFFSQRNDLLLGQYQIGTLLTTKVGQVLSYRDFEIDENPSINKTDFLKNFTVSNSIYSALTVTVTKIGETQVNIPLLGFADSVFFSENETISVLANERVEVEVGYGLNGFLPTATINGTSYTALNYNCFAGQTLKVAFQNTRFIQ